MTDFYLEQFWKLFEFGEKVFRYDEGGLFILTSVDDNFCKMLGFGRAELMIRCHNRAKDLIYPPDLPELHEHVMRELKEKGEYTARYRLHYCKRRLPANNIYRFRIREHVIYRTNTDVIFAERQISSNIRCQIIPIALRQRIVSNRIL